MAKGKRRRVDLDHYSSRDHDPDLAPQTIERHTIFQPGGRRISTHQQYISVPTSPVKANSTSTTQDPDDHGLIFRTEFYDDTVPIPEPDNEPLLDTVLAEDGTRLSGMELLEHTVQVIGARKRSIASVSHSYYFLHAFLIFVSSIDISSSCMGSTHRPLSRRSLAARGTWGCNKPAHMRALF